MQMEQAKSNSTRPTFSETTRLKTVRSLTLIIPSCLGKMLEDMKVKAFKDILNSFENNDFSQFEQLMKND
jgi:hypothetical protein